MGNTKTNTESREQFAESSAKIRSPRIEKDTNALPSALTFFLQTHQRRSVLKALKQLSPDRSVAILTALGLDPSA